MMTNLAIYEGLDDERDRTVFIEHFPGLTIIAYWRDNGTLDFFTIESDQDVAPY
jgi:hypothetical protein